MIPQKKAQFYCIANMKISLCMYLYTGSTENLYLVYDNKSYLLETITSNYAVKKCLPKINNQNIFWQTSNFITCAS